MKNFIVHKSELFNAATIGIDEVYGGFGIFSIKLESKKVTRYDGVPLTFYEKLLTENEKMAQGDKFASVERLLKIVTEAPDMFPVLDVDGIK
jgi:hypothetical protein